MRNAAWGVGVTWRALRWYEQREFLDPLCTPAGSGSDGPRPIRGSIWLLLGAGSTLIDLAMFASLFDQRVPDPPGGRPVPSRCATMLHVTRGSLAVRLIGDVTGIRDRLVALVGDSGGFA